MTSPHPADPPGAPGQRGALDPADPAGAPWPPGASGPIDPSDPIDPPDRRKGPDRREAPGSPDPLAPRRRLRLGVGAAVVLGLVVLSAAVGLGLLRGQASAVESVPVAAETSPSTDSTGELYVHVLGAVERPGLYVVGADARLVDALAAAGGTTGTADLAAVNLARRVEDGEQIVVPAVGATVPGAAAAPSDGRIDLNTADATALETLPRIGPALAARIVTWREENGRFQSVDDLLAVPGIGEKLLAGLRDGVRV